MNYRAGNHSDFDDHTGFEDHIAHDDEVCDFPSRPFFNKNDVERHIQKNEEGDFKKMEQIAEDKSRFNVARFNFRYKDLESNHGFEVTDCSQNDQRRAD